MQTPVSSMLMFLLAAMLGAVGQFLYKAGAERTGGGMMSYLGNWRLLLGVVCYVAVMALFVGAFKRGGQLSVLYPIYASTFVFAAVIALVAYGTPIKPVNVGGMLLLVGGMYLMAK